MLRKDIGDGQNDDLQVSIKGRSGHSMLFDPTHKRVYILGGTRNRTPLDDMLVYDVNTDTLSYILDDTRHIPIAGTCCVWACK